MKSEISEERRRGDGEQECEQEKHVSSPYTVGSGKPVAQWKETKTDHEVGDPIYGQCDGREGGNGLQRMMMNRHDEIPKRDSRIVVIYRE